MEESPTGGTGGTGGTCGRRTLLRVGALTGLTATGTLGGLDLGASGRMPRALAGTAHSGHASGAADLPHGPADSPVKTTATFYTADLVDAARHNVETYGWAGKLRDDAVDAARPYIEGGEAWLWAQVTGQGLPRSYAVNQDLGSPITGRDIYQYGNYPWVMDPIGRPWKLIDPSVPEDSDKPRVYPTNDFAAFYQSALNERGEFDRDLGDKSLLVNELYPDRGPSWGVDDGFGWVDGDGNKWTFLPYYQHWGIWYTDLLGRGIVALRDAYLYTGDPKYARAGLILLDRVADIYPSMDTAPYKREDGYYASDGLSGQGRVVGCIWETGLIRNYVYAYDAFFPAIAESDTLDLVPFLSQRAKEHGLPAMDSVEDIRVNIENGILREVCQGVLDAKIYGNFGMHQHTLAAAAVVLDDPDQSKPWIDFVFASGSRVQDPEYHVTGGAFSQTLVEQVDRDGSGDEGAPGYNDLWIGHVKGVADVLDGYAGYPEADLYKNPKYAKMFQTRYRLPMIGRYIPSIGDTGQTGKPMLFGTASQYVAAFERFGAPEDAQLAYLLGDGDVDGLYSDVFALDVEETQQRIEKVVDRLGPLHPASQDMSGFGLAALRAGDTGHERAAWISYGRSTGHGHHDTLNLGLHAFELDLLPDLGYPEFADSNARREEWTSNTVAHNTVVVDASPQAEHWVGRPYGFAATDRVQLADVAAPEVYPQTGTYRRVTAQVRVDSENSYTVDVFRVAGGTDHHFSFHAAEGAVAADGLNLTPQEGGSYAGPDVEPPPADAPPREGASGFDWLSKVERDGDPPAAFSLDWSVVDTYGVRKAKGDVHLRLHAFHDAGDVALADGIPPRNKPGNPASLRYLVSHRSGTDLASQFVSVIEPYVDTPVIHAVNRVPVRTVGGIDLGHEAAAVKVELAGGRIDYVVSCARTDVEVRVDDAFAFCGSVGVCSWRDGEADYGFSHGAGELAGLPGMTGVPAVLTGTLTGFTTELSASNELTVRLRNRGRDQVDLVGASVYVENDGVRNATYRIQGVRRNGRDTLVLDIGDATPIRGYVDPDDFDQGFRYDVAAGATVRIPVTREWARS